jgi:hypothetical protein
VGALQSGSERRRFDWRAADERLREDGLDNRRNLGRAKRRGDIRRGDIHPQNGLKRDVREGGDVNPLLPKAPPQARVARLARGAGWRGGARSGAKAAEAGASF